MRSRIPRGIRGQSICRPGLSFGTPAPNQKAARSYPIRSDPIKSHANKKKHGKPQGEKMKFRTMMLSLLALVPATISAQAEDAADYPSRKIRMLLPFAAGGGGDVLGRLLADRMGKRLGQTIFIENRTGAAGTIGAQQAATAAADGYTITIGGMTTHVLAPAVYPNLPYDPIKDFTTIGRIGTSAILLVATPDFAANDLRALVEMSKKGEPVQYGSWGVGSTGHFCGEILSQKAGVRLQHVPFSGAAKLANDINARDIEAWKKVASDAKIEIK